MPCPTIARQSWQHVRSSAARPRAAHRHVRQDSAMYLYELTWQLQCAATSEPPRSNLVYAKPEIRQRGASAAMPVNQRTRRKATNLMTAITQNFGSADLKICDRENIFFGNASKCRGAFSSAFLGAQFCTKNELNSCPQN